MSHESKNKMSRQTLVLKVALVVVAIIAVIAATRAWFFESKGLQTMTRVEFPYLYLYGKDTDTVSVELGEIDVREAGEKRIPFRVVASRDSKFKLQLGHTTNLPLTYTIIKAEDDWENWENVSATSENKVEGEYLNKNNSIADKTRHGTTYGDYSQVQKNAEPLYWQSELIPRTKKEHNYILIVTWPKCDDTTVVDKDTEMIYLTAGIPGGNDETD